MRAMPVHSGQAASAPTGPVYTKLSPVQLSQPLLRAGGTYISWSLLNAASGRTADPECAGSRPQGVRAGGLETCPLPDIFTRDNSTPKG